MHYKFVEMIKKHWLLKTDNQTITQTEKQGNIKLKLWRINQITVILNTLGAKNVNT